MSSQLRTNKGLSYVLGDNNDHENHILPVNALQYSPAARQLYSAGRDGTIKVWSRDSPDSSSPGPSSDGHHHAHEYQDIDERLLKLETSISSNPIPCSGSSAAPSPYSIVDNYKIHFDWINDMKLVNNDASLVSCSADLSIKLIDLKSSQSAESPAHDNSAVHKFPNYHTDYIKKLTYNKNRNQVISGGLDGRIIVWDLQTLKPTRHLNNSVGASSGATSSPSSIYSLANNQANLISTGGSSNSINLFDKRSPNPFIRKLIGHQDNIRCLLMTESFILSGSSDTSVKLWDLRNFKVYKNFDIHEYPVWSLTSESNDLSVFYSGDKGGNVIKTDLSYLSSNECTDEFPEFETFTSTDAANIDEKVGISAIVAQGDSPILSLCYEEDTVFTSNYTALNRYHVPDLHNITKYQYLRTSLDYTINKEIQLTEDFASGFDADGAPAANTNEDLNSDFYDIVSHLSVDTNAFDIQSTFSNKAPNLFGELDNTNDSEYEDADDGNEYFSMFLDINGGASKEFVNTYKQDLSEDEKDPFEDPRAGRKSVTSTYPETVDQTPVEILLNSLPQSQITLIPYNTSPISKFRIVPKSIISKRFFNNKRKMLVLYLNGDMTIWDVLLCKETQRYPYPVPNIQPLSGDSLEGRLKDMESIYQLNQTDDTLNNWCDVEIKAGKLLVTIKETSFMNVELYYDDLVNDYPFAALEHADNKRLQKIDKISVTKDDRFYVGSILLNSIFHQYALFEWAFDCKVRDELRLLTKHNKQLDGLNADETALSSKFSNGNGSVDSNAVSSGLRKLKYFGRKSSKSNMSNLSLSSAQNSQQASPTVSTNTSVIEYPIESNPLSEFIRFSGEALKTNNNAPADYTTSNYDTSIMRLLQSNKKVYWEKYHYPTYNSKTGKNVDTMLRVDQIDPSLCENIEEEITYTPIIQPSRLPSDLLITVFEHSPELGNYRDVCSFHLEDIMHIDESKEEMIKNLRLQLPRWIGLSILYNKWPEKESPKISFTLMECEYHLLDPSQKIGGKSQRKIKKLPVLESSIKLTSHNMLRVSKILYYLGEKFESKTSEMKDKKLNPTDWLAIDCRGQELSNDMTLQTIKTKIWKSSADVELRFRRKYDK